MEASRAAIVVPAHQDRLGQKWTWESVQTKMGRCHTINRSRAASKAVRRLHLLCMVILFTSRHFGGSTEVAASLGARSPSATLAGRTADKGQITDEGKVGLTAEGGAGSSYGLALDTEQRLAKTGGSVHPTTPKRVRLRDALLRSTDTLLSTLASAVAGATTTRSHGEDGSLTFHDDDFANATLFPLIVATYVFPLVFRLFYEQRGKDRMGDGRRMQDDVGWLCLAFSLAFTMNGYKKATESHPHRSFSVLWAILALFLGMLYLSFLSENPAKREEWRTGITTIKASLPVRMLCRMLFSLPDGYRGYGICSDTF